MKEETLDGKAPNSRAGTQDALGRQSAKQSLSELENDPAEALATPSGEVPVADPETHSQFQSPELAELLDAGVQVEIDRRKQEELARQGRVSGHD
mgnify:CR=1 FL=1